MVLSKGLVETNEVLEKLPPHLLKLVIDQPYNDYTAQDHALWRFVMRQNVHWLSQVAHGSYLEGLRKTGISINEIPHMYGMNRILKEIGWAAVAVDGFIPPSAFMEFQAYNVLVIAADIRPIDQIEYTPAPDIIHEAAGHAPIIADEEYAAYLKFFGEVGARAFSSKKDYELYEAIRHLSILKADPYSSADEISRASTLLDILGKNMGPPSEMSLIRNLHWWTVEYGLIGDIHQPKIYGAGLLSSIGESYSCLQEEVKKLPYTIDACRQGFDITTRQPQLYVTPDFKNLTTVLNEFVSGMAISKGGIDGLQKAVDSGNTATCVYSSGLQVSGTFTSFISEGAKPVYLKTTGPSNLCFQYKELEGHGRDYHSHGFGSPVGKLARSEKPLELFDQDDLEVFGITEGRQVELEFESGLRVKGKLDRISRKEGKIILLSFSECQVQYKDQVLFEPSWGIFDMAVGNHIISVFSGPADPLAFEMDFPVPEEKTHKIIHNSHALKLFEYYSMVRQVRNGNLDRERLEEIWNEVSLSHPEDWLLGVEILEILTKEKIQPLLASRISETLSYKMQNQPGLETLVSNGLKMIHD